VNIWYIYSSRVFVSFKVITNEDKMSLVILSEAEHDNDF
jgi:hypothetical protein